MGEALEQDSGEWESRRRRKIAMHALCFVLAFGVTWAVGESIGWGLYSGRFLGGVFTLNLFLFEFVFAALIPAIFQARRIRRIAAGDALRESGRSTGGQKS